MKYTEHISRVKGLFLQTYLKKCFLNFGLLILMLHSAPRTLGQAELIQQGSTVLTNGNSSISIPIPIGVTDNKSILVVTAAPKTAATNGPAHTNILSELVCASGTCNTIRIARHGSTGDINIGWKIIEFTDASDIYVTRGTRMHGQINKGTLPDVEVVSVGARVGKSFVLISDLIGGSVTSWDDTVEGLIDSSGDLVLTIGDAKATGHSKEGEVAFQVIDYGPSIVTQGGFQLEDNTTAHTIPISGGIPNPEKSWLIYNYWNTHNTLQPVNRLLVRGAISGNDVVFDRDLTNSSTLDLYGNYFLIEFTDATTVQHGNMSFTTTELKDSLALGRQVNPICAIPVVGYQQRGGKSNTAISNFAPGWFLAEISTDGNKVILTRGETDNSTAEGAWSVVEFDYCPPMCSIDDLQMEPSCDDNATPYDDSDDFVTFDLDPIGSGIGATYTVSVDNGATVTPSGGSYGSSTSFHLQNGSADGTEYTITITDDDEGGCQSIGTVDSSLLYCVDTDDDGVTDDLDIDDDNDGLVDNVEVVCSADSWHIGWFHGVDDEATIMDPDLILTGHDESYGSGLSASTGGTLLQLSGIAASDLSESIANQEYVEYSFTTKASLSQDFFLSGVVQYETAPGNYNGHQLAVFFSENGFTNSIELIRDVTTLDGPGYQSYDVSEKVYQFDQATTYTLRVYIYNIPPGNSGQATLDDFTLNICEGDFDADEDGVWNHHDLDSDNDGIYDVLEAGGADPDFDGVVGAGSITDTDNDGWSNITDPDNGGTALTDHDTDGDGNENRIDSDSDADGCSDTIEAGFPDSDGDSQLGGLVPPTVNASGTVTSGGL